MYVYLYRIYVGILGIYNNYIMLTILNFKRCYCNEHNI